MPGVSIGRRTGLRAHGLIGVSRPGSNAEYTVVPATNVQRLPEEMSFVEGAVLAANGPLAHAQLTAARAAPGEWILVLGATGSVGSLGVALAARNGSRVIAVTGVRRRRSRSRSWAPSSGSTLPGPTSPRRSEQRQPGEPTS